MIELAVPTGVTAYNVNGDNVDIPVGAKTVSVSAIDAEVLKSHGFYVVGTEPAAPLSIEIGAVHVPRQVALGMLKNLGVVVADSTPSGRIVEALVEGCRRQGERVMHEVKIAEQRGRAAAMDELTSPDTEKKSSDEKKSDVRESRGK